MKIFIIAAFVVFFATVNADYPKEENEEHNKIISECREKFKVPDGVYTKLRYDEISEPDENMRCLVDCFMDKVGVLKGGEFQKEVASIFLIKSFGEEKANDILNTCSGESGPERCETAYKLHKCLIKTKAY